MGLNKSSIVSGNYNLNMLHKIKDRTMFFETEERISHFRDRYRDYMDICEFIGKKDD